MIADYVEKLGEAGIYSILDCHQDLLSPKFCGQNYFQIYMYNYVYVYAMS